MNIVNDSDPSSDTSTGKDAEPGVPQYEPDSLSLKTRPSGQ